MLPASLTEVELSRHHGEGNHTLQERRESKAKRASTPRPRTWDLLNAMNRGPSEYRGRTTTFKKKGMQRTTRAESSGTCKMMLYNVRIDLNYLSRCLGRKRDMGACEASKYASMLP